MSGLPSSAEVVVVGGGVIGVSTAFHLAVDVAPLAVERFAGTRMRPEYNII